MTENLSVKRASEMEFELLRIGGADRGGRVWMAYQWAEAVEAAATPEERQELERAITRVCRLLAPVVERATGHHRGDTLPPRPPPHP